MTAQEFFRLLAKQPKPKLQPRDPDYAEAKRWARELLNTEGWDAARVEQFLTVLGFEHVPRVMKVITGKHTRRRRQDPGAAVAPVSTDAAVRVQSHDVVLKGISATPALPVRNVAPPRVAGIGSGRSLTPMAPGPARSMILVR